jgi:hypothetical protein
MSTQSFQENCAVQVNSFPRPPGSTLTLQPGSVQKSETSTYHYEDLPDGCIRLIELLPGNGHHPLRCQLVQVALSEERPYEAISYVWGNSTDTIEIECEGQQLAIGTNLKDAFLRLRSTTEVRVLWADAICIHQANLAEKMQQVKLMGLIYYKATRVLAWLGFGDNNEESGIEVALYTMKNISAIFPPLPSRVGNVGFRTHSSDEVAGSRSNQNRWEAIYQFFELPWFKRVWVVQEAGLAIDLLYHCGNSTISRSELHVFIDWLTGPGEAVRRYFEIDLRQHYMAQNYIAHVRHNKPCDTFTFLEILEGGSGLACSDPRDAIYAFLGHPSAFVPGSSQLRGTVVPHYSSISSSKTMIDPDYTKDLATLYYDTVVVLLRNADLGPGLLLYVGHNEISLESTCPSWIPQWHVPEVHLFFPGHSTRAASGELKHSTFDIIGNGDLRLKAVPLDRVQFTWVFAGQDCFAILNNVHVHRDNTIPEKDLSPVEYLWREFSAIRYMLPNPSYSNIHSFCVTLTAGTTGDTAPISALIGFKKPRSGVLNYPKMLKAV